MIVTNPLSETMCIHDGTSLSWAAGLLSASSAITGDVKATDDGFHDGRKLFLQIRSEHTQEQWISEYRENGNRD